MFICNYIVSSDDLSDFSLRAVSSAAGLSALNMEETGRMGRRTVVYYAFTTVMAVLVGVMCVLIIHPGNPNSKGVEGAIATGERVKAIDTTLDILRYRKPQGGDFLCS